MLVNSSASHRCLTSAAATMASFYTPEESWKMDDRLNWQPIPIHYLPLYQDKAKFEYVSNYAGFNIFQGMYALHLYDTLRIEVYVWFLSSSFSFIGPLLQDIDQNMRKKINWDLPHLKIQMYSAHDINIAAILLALNFTNMRRPPYCATLLFELHEMSDASMTLRLLYLNSTDPLAGMGEPHVLELDDCSEFCPVEDFTKKLLHLMPENWEQECQLNILDTCDSDNCEIFRVIQNNK
ncbi:unnamed protein product [Larinioides sclopetarius]